MTYNLSQYLKISATELNALSVDDYYGSYLLFVNHLEELKKNVKK